MNNILEHTEAGREIARKNYEQGRADVMRDVLEAAYGDVAGLDALARRLADRDFSATITRIIGGATLDELRA